MEWRGDQAQGRERGTLRTQTERVPLDRAPGRVRRISSNPGLGHLRCPAPHTHIPATVGTPREKGAGVGWVRLAPRWQRRVKLARQGGQMAREGGEVDGKVAP